LPKGEKKTREVDEEKHRMRMDKDVTRNLKIKLSCNYKKGGRGDKNY
jgi:hypothetical protein